MNKKVIQSKTVTRAPIVVIMGHIDHGKSTLLDHIRKSNIVASEAGGITQAVSAYEVSEPYKITFIDTPGHAAFCGMRGRCAEIADIAVLIVSAEDGVKPQTVEALKAIHQSEIPFIVAINKIDRPTANIERTKQQLAEIEVLVEGYGGTIPVVMLSAKTGENISDLLEMINLVAELEDFQMDPKLPGEGVVLETNLCPKTGVAATLIIKNGTVNLGDWLVATSPNEGGTLAKIKRLNNFLGQAELKLSASSPAQVIGWNEPPTVGATFKTYRNKKDAEQAMMEAKNGSARGSTLGILKVEPRAPNAIEIPILIKAAVAGSLDAMEHEINKLSTAVVGLKIIQRDVGQVTENDVKLAAGSSRSSGDSRDSLILGFNVKIDKSAAELAEKLGVKIVTDEIIYKLSEWLEIEIAHRTPTQEIEQSLGRAKLLKIFGDSKGKQIIGGAVTEGHIVDSKLFKIWRRETEIGRGKITELQQQKIKVKEVPQDSQFGALVEAKVTLAAGDMLEVFDLVTK
jgi:translation initiation factor IF-2